MRIIYILFIIISLFISCCSVIPDYDPIHNLIFQTGFKESIVSERNQFSDKISGTDNDFTEKSSWQSIVDGKWITNAWINYEAGSRYQRFAQIDKDPLNGNNPVLKYKIIEPHIIEGNHQKGRVSAILETKGIYCITQSVRLYLHPDMANLKNWDQKVDWLTLFEFWCTDKYRITISLHKTSISGDEMHFKFASSTRSLFGPWKEDWSEIADEYKIPFGEWMSLEIYLKIGDATKGNLKLSVSDNSSAQQVIINRKRNYGNSKGFTLINPMKLYTSDKLINYMASNGWNLEIYWDDWKLYRN